MSATRLRLPRRFARSIPSIKILCTGGFQHASKIADAIRSGACDGVSIGRSLIANPNLPEMLKTADGPPAGKECTYCNKCLINDLENPLGCYELSRFEGRHVRRAL